MGRRCDALAIHFPFSKSPARAKSCGSCSLADALDWRVLAGIAGRAGSVFNQESAIGNQLEVVKMQQFHHGDHVKLADDYSKMWRFENGESTPIKSEYAGMEAIVIASYSDQYRTPDSGGGYTLRFRRGGEVSWFYDDDLTLISSNALSLLDQWKKEQDDEIKMKSDLDWIFDHGEEVLKSPHGASICALAACFGLTNLWGRSGEGIVWYENACITMHYAAHHLKAGDKAGWLELCDKVLTSKLKHI